MKKRYHFSEAIEPPTYFYYLFEERVTSHWHRRFDECSRIKPVRFIHATGSYAHFTRDAAITSIIQMIYIHSIHGSWIVRYNIVVLYYSAEPIKP